MIPVVQFSEIKPYSNIKLNNFLRTRCRVSDVLFKYSFYIKFIPGDLLFFNVLISSNISVSFMGSL